MSWVLGITGDYKSLWVIINDYDDYTWLWVIMGKMIIDIVHRWSWLLGRNIMPFNNNDRTWSSSIVIIKIICTFYEKLKYRIFISAIYQRRFAIVPEVPTPHHEGTEVSSYCDVPWHGRGAKKPLKITTTHFMNEPPELSARLSVKSKKLCEVQMKPCPLHCVFSSNVRLI